MNLCSILALSLLAFAGAPYAHAQEPAPAKPEAKEEAKPEEKPEAEAKEEEASVSRVANIALPQSEPKARRVIEKAAVEGLSGQLKKLARQAGIPLGAPEVLAWSGEGYKREEAKTLVAAMTSALKEAGFAYRAIGGPLPAQGSTTTLFSANKDDKKSMLMGYWVEADNMLVLVWAALENPDAEAFPGQK